MTTQTETMLQITRLLRDAAKLIANAQREHGGEARAVLACQSLERFAIMALPQNALGVEQIGQRGLSLDRKMLLNGNKIICNAVTEIKEQKLYHTLVEGDKACLGK